MLKHRVISGLLAGVSLVLVALYLPLIGLWLVLTGLSILCQLEFYGLIRKAGIPVFNIVGTVCGVAMVSTTFFAAALGDMGAAYKWENFVLIAGLIGVFVRQFPQKHNDRPIETIACTLLGIWYIPFLLNFFTRLVFTPDGVTPPGHVTGTGRLLVVYLMAVVKSTDMGAYFVGRAWGRHKLFPRISPAKTWEGLAGGVGAAVLVSCLLATACRRLLVGLDLGLADAFAIGILLSLGGVVGDMFESLLKRAAGAKDSGTLVPGMGGVLDVLDSLLFGVPLLYVYTNLFLR